MITSIVACIVFLRLSRPPFHLGTTGKCLTFTEFVAGLSITLAILGMIPFNSRLAYYHLASRLTYCADTVVFILWFIASILTVRMMNVYPCDVTDLGIELGLRSSYCTAWLMAETATAFARLSIMLWLMSVLMVSLPGDLALASAKKEQGHLFHSCEACRPSDR